MEALEALLTRRSVRSYEARMPEQELIDKVMEAGLYAASGKNMQTAIIVEVTNKEVRDRLSVINAEIMGVTSDPFYGAPVVLVVLADKSSPNHVYDGALMMGNLMNAAHTVCLTWCRLTLLRSIAKNTEANTFIIAFYSPLSQHLLAFFTFKHFLGTINPTTA